MHAFASEVACQVSGGVSGRSASVFSSRRIAIAALLAKDLNSRVDSASAKSSSTRPEFSRTGCVDFAIRSTRRRKVAISLP